VVWREREQPGEVEIVLVQTPARRWSLPKGTPENGEKLDETALREVSEETGLQVQLEEKIGVMRYSFGGQEARIDKAVHFWLMQATGGSFEDHDEEHIDVRWVGLGDAMRMVSYRNTATLLEDAAAMLDRRVGPAQA
jgi:8-oxo-dGTP pyrophosphatase MutT (NUDIX family)